MNDPYLILGLNDNDDTDDASVERAYHDAIRHCPPERDPERFNAIRRAYEQLRTRRDRLSYDLFDTSAPTPADLIARATRTSERGRPDAAQLQALLRGNP